MIERPRFVYVVNLGDAPAEHLKGIAESIEDQFGLPAKIIRDTTILRCALDPNRNQHNSNIIIKKLLEICPPDAVKILGVTGCDLFSPIFSFVFGEAQFMGKGAVVSSYRLQGSPEQELAQGCPPLISRIEKEAIHELGHTFGLKHCPDPDCVMHYSVGLQCADRKFPFFCRPCRETVLWHLASDLFLKA